MHLVSSVKFTGVRIKLELDGKSSVKVNEKLTKSRKSLKKKKNQNERWCVMKFVIA